MGVKSITKEWFDKHREQPICQYASCPVCELLTNPIWQDELIEVLNK